MSTTLNWSLRKWHHVFIIHLIQYNTGHMHRERFCAPQKTHKMYLCYSQKPEYYYCVIPLVYFFNAHIIICPPNRLIMFVILHGPGSHSLWLRIWTSHQSSTNMNSSSVHQPSIYTYRRWIEMQKKCSSFVETQ